MIMAWFALKLLFPDKPALRVMGLFGCTHKTVAMGIPLINSIFEDNPAVGLYTLPLLIWHPMQLVIGTMLSPRLASFVERENERLGISDEDAEEFDSVVRSRAMSNRAVDAANGEIGNSPSGEVDHPSNDADVEEGGR